MLSNPQDYLQDLDEDVEEEAEAPEPAEHSPDSDELDAAAEEEGMVRVEIPDGDPAWDTFDNLVESWLETASSPSKKPREPHVKSFADQEADDDIVSGVMCARCYSLRHYGKVKSAEAESDLPEFDIARMVGRRIALQKFRRSVVLVVVDLADFDGSLPRTAVRLLLPPELREVDASQRLPSGFRLVVAANKADLLPSQVTEARLQAWVRRRMAQGGLPRPSAVHIVSSEKGRGVKALLADLQTAVGTRGDVWVIGAQNAGKSSLINAMRRAVGLREGRQVTAAPLPGTTLGVVPVPSLLPRGCKMLDTPGVPHTYQLAAYMTPEEVR